MTNGRTLNKAIVGILYVVSVVTIWNVGKELWNSSFGIEKRYELSQEKARPYYEKGVAHLQKREYILAEQELEHAVEIAPKYELAWWKLSEVRDQLDKTEESNLARVMATHI